MNEAITLSTLGPHSPEYTARVGNALAECVRVLNYATRPPASEALEYPGDVYQLLGSLYTATERMPQLFRQLDEWLGRQEQAGRVGVDGGSRDAAVRQVELGQIWLRSAAAAALDLTRTLQSAQNSIAHLHGLPEADEGGGQ